MGATASVAPVSSPSPEEDVNPYARHGSCMQHPKEEEEEEEEEEEGVAEGPDGSECNGSFGYAPGSPAGMVWHAQVVPDDYNDPKHCLPSGKLKPRRPTPHVRATEFFGALVASETGAWVFPGPLNGWPGLRGLEVRAVTGRVRSRLGVPRIVRHWQADGASGPPAYPSDAGSVRVTLQAPAWSLLGWTAQSPGFCFWAARQRNGGIKVFFGSGILEALAGGNFSDVLPSATHAFASRAHVFAHRYAKASESTKDRLTYHAGVLLEWSHGLGCTVFELAWRNGLGGYGGKSNWFHDKDSGHPALYAAMPPCLKAPWKASLAEIRATDVAAASLTEFRAYLDQYTGTRPQDRFLVPEIVVSGDVRLSHRGLPHITQYLLNYAAADPAYTEESRNCQTFAADFFRFLTGNSAVDPYHALNRVFYKPAPHLFLYEPTLWPHSPTSVSPSSPSPSSPEPPGRTDPTGQHASHRPSASGTP